MCAISPDHVSVEGGGGGGKGVSDVRGECNGGGRV